MIKPSVFFSVIEVLSSTAKFAPEVPSSYNYGISFAGTFKIYIALH